jgi:hypothetical protein
MIFDAAVVVVDVDVVAVADVGSRVRDGWTGVVQL